ncbi:ATP-dependent Clp protease adapter protein CLPS2, chloroplastic-like [Amaranthus tricolor]|uniref:ATP-dependent Clp protease adapter protein CLPS2, chloroplastic-like n=1 Tax=Amaranthus tricolor TaxID=29722 RepID=UPI0025853DE4|nr:ATP-dependent Clp protease adapter protein CLPS2, chloroplastic-like [Amaranthus tricolor]
MASSTMPFLAGTTTPPIPKGLRHVPLSRVKVSNYMNSNSRIEKRGNDGFCVAYNSMSLVDKSRLSSLRSGGSVVLERPSFDQSQFDPSPQVEQGGDIGRLKDKRAPVSGDGYRVLLLDDPRHTEYLVLKVLPQVVPSITAVDASKIFTASRQYGFAVVIVTVKEYAEFYSHMMILRGLRSLIEADSYTV